MIERVKLNIDDMVAAILDRLPPEVWTSSTTTFMDPSMAGGQFVRAIEMRLRECGHTDENISKRVWGFEESKLRVIYAKNKFKLVGCYSSVSHDELFDAGIDMKFDVIVGNPPYQNGKNHNFYVKFVELMLNHLKDEKSVIAVVTPNRLFIPDHDLNKITSNVTITDMWWDATKAFNWDVKTFIVAWIASNRKPNNEKINSNIDIEIRNGDMAPSSGEFDMNAVSFNILKKIINYKEKLDFCSKRNNQHDIFIKRQWRRWNSITKCGGKHCFNPSTIENDGKFLPAFNDVERRNAEFYVCESKTIRFLTHAFSGSMNVPPFLWKMIPGIDISTSELTDAKIYDILNFDSKEIEYIENVIK